MTELAKPQVFSPIVNSSGAAELEMILWMENITRLSPANGTGSPEGVIEGLIGRSYVDVAAAPGSVFYVKQLNDVGGDSSLGWVLIG